MQYLGSSVFKSFLYNKNPFWINLDHRPSLLTQIRQLGSKPQQRMRGSSVASARRPWEQLRPSGAARSTQHAPREYQHAHAQVCGGLWWLVVLSFIPASTHVFYYSSNS